MSLQDKLGAAKEKAALREFEVRITETLQKTVVVEACDRQEAKRWRAKANEVKVELKKRGWKSNPYFFLRLLLRNLPVLKHKFKL